MNESTKKLFKAAADIIVKNCGDRKIFFLGSGDDFQNYLRDEYKIEISGYATYMAPKAVNGKMMLDDMINKTNEYYIVVPMIRSSPTLRKRFKQLENAFFVVAKPPRHAYYGAGKRSAHRYKLIIHSRV